MTAAPGLAEPSTFSDPFGTTQDQAGAQKRIGRNPRDSPCREDSRIQLGALLDRAENREPDLAVEVFIGPRDVAATEPDADFCVGGNHAGIAEYFRIPGLVSGKHGWQLHPMDAIGRARQTEAAVFVDVASGVEHPIETFGNPDSRLAQTVLIESAA